MEEAEERLRNWRRPAALLHSTVLNRSDQRWKDLRLSKTKIFLVDFFGLSECCRLFE